MPQAGRFTQQLCIFPTVLEAGRWLIGLLATALFWLVGRSLLAVSSHGRVGREKEGEREMEREGEEQEGKGVKAEGEGKERKWERGRELSVLPL